MDLDLPRSPARVFEGCLHKYAEYALLCRKLNVDILMLALVRKHDPAGNRVSINEIHRVVRLTRAYLILSLQLRCRRRFSALISKCDIALFLFYSEKCFKKLLAIPGRTEFGIEVLRHMGAWH